MFGIIGSLVILPIPFLTLHSLFYVFSSGICSQQDYLLVVVLSMPHAASDT